jgi:hypothetical protein
MQHSTYLESKVLTAAPQRLQLLLIEGAIRFGRQAEEALRNADRVAASSSLLRTIDIIGELLAAARALFSTDSEFRRRSTTLVQRSPDVAFAYAAAKNSVLST